MELILSILSFLNPFAWIGKGIKYYKRPKLVVYYDANETYKTRGIVGQNNTPGFFCHVMVKNDGNKIARSCRGRVINIQMEDENGNFRKHEMFSAPMILKWAHENDFNPKDIEADLPRRLDLCFGMQVQPNNLFIFTEHKPDGNLKIYPPGRYQLKVRIDSENAKTVDRYFIVEFKGGWNKITIEEP
jgi:hypothetical protein